MKKIKVYIAGPYSNGDTLQNVKQAVFVAEELFSAGLVPFIPHLNHFWHIWYPHSYQAWLDYDKQWLPLCDCLLRIDGFSEGAEDECALMRSLGKSVFYSIDELLEWADCIPNETTTEALEEAEVIVELEDLNCQNTLINARNAEETASSRPVIKEYSAGDAT